MALKPLEPQEIQGTLQVLFAYLSDERNSTPNDMLEGVVSAKSLVRGLLSGELMICRDEVPVRKNVPPGPNPDDTPANDTPGPKPEDDLETAPGN